MTRPKKTAKARHLNARAREHIKIRDEIEETPVPEERSLQKIQIQIPSNINTNSKLKLKVRNSRKASGVAASGDRDRARIQRRVVQKTNKEVQNSAELLNLLEKIAVKLTVTGDSQAADEVLKTSGLEDVEQVANLQEHCKTISDHLSSLGQRSSSVPSTIDLYDQMFVYRARGKRVYFLCPLDVLQGTSGCNRRKVMGSIKTKGASLPLIYATPGWKACMEPHPRLLDSEIWTDEVKRWGIFHNHHFKKYVFDERHGQVPGHTYASHVEPKLMLWYACWAVGKFFGIKGSIRTQIGELYCLPHLEMKLEAKLKLTEEPCGDCQRFQILIEKYTRIKFHITIVRNLGQLKPFRNKQKQKDYPLLASDSEDQDEDVIESDDDDIIDMTLDDDDEEEEDDEDVQIQERQVFCNSKMDASIRDKVSSSAPSKTQQELERMRALNPIPVVWKTPTKQKEMIQSFTCTRTSSVTAHNPTYESDNDPDWEPPKSIKYNRTYVPQPTTPVKQTRIYAPPTPDSMPFPPEARARVMEMEKKQKKRHAPNFSDTPTPSKKSRRHGY